MSKRLSIVALLITIAFGYGQSDVKPLKVLKGELIFSDDFERAQIGDTWEIKDKFNDAFQIKNGALFGKELVDAGHGSVARAHFSFSDVVIEFDFRFKGAKRFNLVMDDSLCKSVRAGHISRVSFSNNDFRVQDDKTGSMNLKVRDKRLKSPDKKEEIKEFLKTKMNVKKLRFEEGQWYHVVITKLGDILECKVGSTIAQIKS
ncbi:hypothetical protein [Seonamhaeicola marinus]|uniref:DUF1080 domain-containing protein n=1 Tax=Seonamhaeicola marinus TaxID=1912246 RepID=A0A5D0I7J8_9FLAO|nr:hypothetical protein [Seonamhaeicola marinus]TYA78367.1 hypothetical protein FUA24_08390 [Seonamhaeicola marinus]